ncbi:MAG: hypothetical protein SPL71_03435 [Oribacterium sp.]|nr:hypothetical protein [Oribacterium sp.]
MKEKVDEMETGYEKAEEGFQFGLPFVLLRHVVPYDTTTLNYNWQIFGTQAFSLYSRVTSYVDAAAADESLHAILRFLRAKGFVKSDVSIEGRNGSETGETGSDLGAFDLSHPVQTAVPSVLYRESNMDTALSTAGGLLVRYADPGDHIKGGALLGRIENPCDGETLEELRAQRDGIVFFAHHANLINGHEVAFRVVPD